MAVIGRERSPFAADPSVSRGRRLPEAPSPTRNEFQRDRDRVIHSTAFRRLKDKTQVFVFDEGDHYRTRLTHTIEVAQIARALARALGLDEDLAEGLALAHDLGHPPFGHSGEDTLDACMAGFGGFDHNAQSVRVVTKLERRYAAYDGLNLAWESIEGLVKHNGPLTNPDGSPAPRHRERGVPEALAALARDYAVPLANFASAEAQAAAIADDIAYDAHDIDDGARAGLVDLDHMAREVPLVGRLLAEVDRLHAGAEPSRRAYEVVRRLITRLIEDVIAETGRRLAALLGEGVDAVREAGHPVVAFSDALAREETALKAYLYAHFYRAERVMAVRERANAVLRRLFERYMDDPLALPEAWRLGPGADDSARARHVCDFLAGQTDRFAMQEHARLFGAWPDLRGG